MAEKKQKRRMSPKVFDILFSVAAIIAMWLVWLIAYYAEGNPYVIPSVGETLKEFFSLLSSSAFWSAFGSTLLRTLYAFLVSFALASVFAALSMISRRVYSFLNPIVTVLRTVPTMAIILILLLWTSHGTAPIIVGALVTFPMVYSQLRAAFADIDPGLTEMARVYGVGRGRRLFKIYLPMALPNILTQCGASFSLTLKVIVSAEVMANTFGSMGGLMQSARTYLDIPALFALTLLTVLAGTVAEILLSFLPKICCRWRKRA